MTSPEPNRTESGLDLAGRRLLVTGGSGFIGTHLIGQLMEQRCQILNLDIAPPLLAGHESVWTRCDIRDRSEIARQFSTFNPEFVIHLAARTDTNGTTLEQYDHNTLGTENVVEATSACRSIRRIVVTSTQFVLRPGRLPMHDEDYDPHTVYGTSKVVTEQVTRRSRMAACWTIIRPTNVWGPWHPRYPKEFWRILKKGLYVHPNGRQPVRCYGYVENVVWQILKILGADERTVCSATFYVGDPPIELVDWVNRFSEALTGRPARVVPRPLVRAIAWVGDAFNSVGVRFPITSSRFRSMTEDYPTPMEPTLAALGSPPISLDEGVERTVHWLRQTGFFES